jgi:4-hydroxy-tetrahydrodipicolinate synthase
MTERLNIAGVWTALVTPFATTGEFDANTYSRLLDFQLAAGVDGLVPCGTTGESPTLSWEEHGAAVALSVRRAAGRAKVMAGSGSNSTDEAINGTRDAWSRGADAALLVDCYYNGPSSLELRTEYYERILAAVPELPLIPYVIPGRTGCALSAEDLAILHGIDPVRIPGVKSATGDLQRMRRDRATAGAGLQIASGDDELTLAMMRDPEIGACGVVSVISNVLPGALIELCKAKTPAAGDAAQAALEPLFQTVTCIVENPRVLPNGQRVIVSDKFRNPSAIKTMMAGLGMIKPVNRAPLGKMTPIAVEKCRTALRAVYETRPDWFAPIESVFEVNIEARLADDAVWASLARD